MRAQSEAHAPSRMVSETDELCQKIRRRKPSIYSELLRENILEVLKCSFPRFGTALAPGKLDEIASHFLSRHGAKRPQFHHIATEIVEFAHRGHELSKPLICLLEYEWILLSTEIDSARIQAPQLSGNTNWDTSKISLNPTAEIVATPFDITLVDIPVELDGTEQNYVYAVYRTVKHTVVTRSLSYVDYCLIDLIRREGEVAFNALVSAPPVQLTTDAIRQWVIEQSQNGLVICGTEC
ncbi:MAG: putative DNA-binding domain-containing protein [Proteobacteria bacterium]|nr:putative DNA-binding domain-containing protein [Pseudomonadota bacterium]MBS0269315.1 putative DNA-binding domain-containing protein [Pseudomonadota bacterium]